MNQKKKNFNTRAIHAGAVKKNPENALNYPIFMTSTFTFNDVDHVNKVMSFESDDYVYTRGNNPTLRLLENRMADLENGKAAVAFASGMAAISSTLLSFLKPGDQILAHKTLYGSSYTVITKLFESYNISHKLIDFRNIEEIKENISPKTKVFYFETPANPSLDIIDIKKVADLGKENKIETIVDNTFASPYFQNPLDLGASVVVHSATKYLGGHGDIVAGIAISKDEEYIQKLKFEYMCELGGVMSPFNAWLILRGIKTLGLRMKQHAANALEVANYLNNQKKITKIIYPGLASCEGHQLAKKQMRGFGAMISFELASDFEGACKFIEALKLHKLAVSLGDCESLVEFPALMTHRGYSEADLKKFGLSKSMIRISVGLEEASDIIEDLDQGLKEI